MKFNKDKGNGFLKLIATILIIGVFGFIFLLSGTDISNNESIMLGVLLTIFSVIASLIITQLYTKESFNKNLEIYARKASEKVDNLSKELTRLAGYLETELDDEKYDSVEENLNAKEERIRSAIHIIYTVRSFNDKSLSDWEGVLGEELDERRERQQEKEDDIKEVVKNAEELFEDNLLSIDEPKNYEVILNIQELRKELKRALSSEIGISIKSKIKREETVGTCLECSENISYKQKPIVNSRKKVNCKNCGAKLLSSWNKDDGFKLIKNSPSTKKNKPQISEELIQEIKNRLPEQPWPKGTVKNIADELEISHTIATRVVNTLMRDGDFKIQIDGKLYSPEK